jgi:hypothetical protein
MPPKGFTLLCKTRRNRAGFCEFLSHLETTVGPTMGRYLLLWLLGVPIPILVLIWAFGGLH